MTSTQSEIRHLCDKAGYPDLFDKLKAGTVAEAQDALIDAIAAAKQAKQAKPTARQSSLADLAALVGPALAARNGVKQGEAAEPAKAPVQAEPAAVSFEAIADRVYGARQAGKVTGRDRWTNQDYGIGDTKAAQKWAAS